MVVEPKEKRNPNQFSGLWRGMVVEPKEKRKPQPIFRIVERDGGGA
jgi:hypothetical protein